MGDADLKVKLCGLIHRGDRLELVHDWNDCPEVDALVDTEAYASVITCALAERAGAKIMPGLRTFRGRAYAGALMALELEGCARSNHVVIVDDRLVAEAESHGGMILGCDYLSDHRVRIDEVRSENVIRLKITQAEAEATALRGFSRQLARISIDASDDVFDERANDADTAQAAQERGASRADPLDGLVREVRPDVEPNGASAVPIGDEGIRYKLRARGKYRANHCFLYFEVERKKRAVTIETSWLPDLPAVRDVLGPMGFAREPRGAWRANLAEHGARPSRSTISSAWPDASRGRSNCCSRKLCD